MLIGLMLDIDIYVVKYIKDDMCKVSSISPININIYISEVFILTSGNNDP